MDVPWKLASLACEAGSAGLADILLGSRPKRDMPCQTALHGEDAWAVQPSICSTALAGSMMLRVAPYRLLLQLHGYTCECLNRVQAI